MSLSQRAALAHFIYNGYVQIVVVFSWVPRVLMRARVTTPVSAKNLNPLNRYSYHLTTSLFIFGGRGGGVCCSYCVLVVLLLLPVRPTFV